MKTRIAVAAVVFGLLSVPAQAGVFGIFGKKNQKKVPTSPVIRQMQSRPVIVSHPFVAGPR